MKDGFISVAAGTPKLKLADCRYNAEQIFTVMRAAEKAGVRALILPELCVTGATCGDLFFQDTLLKGAEDALITILEATRNLEIITAVGLPVRVAGNLYNCAAVIQKGVILGVVPKKILSDSIMPESRWFSSYQDHDFSNPANSAPKISIAGQSDIAFSPGLIFQCRELPDFTIGVEIDLFAPIPQSVYLAANGAVMIGCLSACPDAVSAATNRRKTVTALSARLKCGYIFAGADDGESVSDYIFGAHQMIAENGALLAERRFDGGLLISEIDIQKLRFERRRTHVFDKNNNIISSGCSAPPPVIFSMPVRETKITRYIPKSPFVPETPNERAYRCREILFLSALGLKRRMQDIGAKTAVLGLSGGLDSTLAVFITARAMSMLGRPASDIIAVTMPGFGTTDNTKGNAVKLAESLGVSLRNIPISAAVSNHFRDIGHDPAIKNAAYENAQARERTQILMDIANDTGGIVIGTGDLSELALGWCTYNGDHMSMYGVNASIPKTLVRSLVRYAAENINAENAANYDNHENHENHENMTSVENEANTENAENIPNAENAGNSGHDAPGTELSRTLYAILETPVSPELLPAVQGGGQHTEELIGPYELHDFFLYYILRWGFSPRKIYRLALESFGKDYSAAVILHWLKIFYQRFFSQQFKRNCMPDGAGVGAISLSPRTGWHMPSDASRVLWEAELENMT